jgi:nucleotide-binding universal stress UspA family protein
MMIERHEKIQKILVAIDDSDASMKAVRYLSEMIEGRDNVRIFLFHVLPPIPPKFLEFGGAEDPQKERRLSEELKSTQAQWIENAKTAAHRSLKDAQAIFMDHRLSPDQISTSFSSSIHKPDVVREILEAATQWQCGTIVVGRHRLPWVKELFYRHTGEKLIEKAEDRSVWVVG